MERRRLETQLDLTREIYLAERGRIDQIRSSLGLPLAALSFAAVGFVGLARILVFDTSSVVAFALSLAAAVLGLFSVALFIRAALGLRDFDYSHAPVSPSVANFADSVRDTAGVYAERLSIDRKEAEEAAITDTLAEVAKGYAAAIRDISARNATALETQRTIFRDLLFGLALLLLAIAATGALRLAMPQ